MNHQNFAPHLSTVQRNSLSNQIRDGFLIFHLEEDQFEQWDASTRTWLPMFGANNISTVLDGNTGGSSGSCDCSEYDFFIAGSVSVPVNQTEAIQDWNNC